MTGSKEWIFIRVRFHFATLLFQNSHASFCSHPHWLSAYFTPLPLPWSAVSSRLLESVVSSWHSSHLTVSLIATAEYSLPWEPLFPWVQGFEDTMLFGVFLSFSHSFFCAPLSLWPFSRVWELSFPFAVLSICRFPSFSAIQTEVPCKFVSGGQRTLWKWALSTIVSLTAPFGCLVGVLNLAFPQPCFFFPQAPSLPFYWLSCLIHANFVFPAVQAQTLSDNLSYFQLLIMIRNIKMNIQVENLVMGLLIFSFTPHL